MPKQKQKGLNQEVPNLSRFTLSSPEDNNDTSKAEFSSNTTKPIAESTEEESFWATRVGKMWVIGFICLILTSLAGSFTIFRIGTQKDIQSNPESILPSTSPTVSPAPSPSVVNKSIYKIKVLNGSGTKGEAANAKAILEKEGFVVSDIGNAPENNYQESIISTKKLIGNEFVSEIKMALKSYIFSDKASELTENDDVDVVIIVGSKQ